MTILHQMTRRKAAHRESYAATRMMYARKYFSPGHRALYTAAVLLRHLLRLVYSGTGELADQKRAANRAVIATLFGRRPVPFAAITARYR